MHPLTALRARRPAGVLLLDGGLATEVERRGVSIDGVLWSARALVERPDVVRAIHDDYLAAGADVIATATYQAAFATLAQAGLDAAAVLSTGVMLAREARDASGREALVAASMGPYGAHLADGSEYRGDYRVPHDELRAFHERQAEALWAAGPDLLAFETIPSLGEAEAILRAVEALGSPPAWLSFSVRDDGHLSAGESIAGAAAIVASELGAVGLNCASPEILSRAAGSLAGVERLLYPNSGESWSAAARSWTGTARVPADLLHLARAWRAAGVTIAGGCCRTTPADIARLARVWSAA